MTHVQDAWKHPLTISRPRGQKQRWWSKSLMWFATRNWKRASMTDGSKRPLSYWLNCSDPLNWNRFGIVWGFRGSKKKMAHLIMRFILQSSMQLSLVFFKLCEAHSLNILLQVPLAAQDFGMAQSRRRLFLVALRKKSKKILGINMKQPMRFLGMQLT